MNRSRHHTRSNAIRWIRIVPRQASWAVTLDDAPAPRLETFTGDDARSRALEAGLRLAEELRNESVVRLVVDTVEPETAQPRLAS